MMDSRSALTGIVATAGATALATASLGAEQKASATASLAPDMPILGPRMNMVRAYEIM